VTGGVKREIWKRGKKGLILLTKKRREKYRKKKSEIL